MRAGRSLVGLLSVVGVLLLAPASTTATAPAATVSLVAPFHGWVTTSAYHWKAWCAGANAKPRPTFGLSTGVGSLNVSTWSVPCSYFPGDANATAGLAVKIPLPTHAGVSSVGVNLTYRMGVRTTETLYCGSLNTSYSWCEAWAQVKLILSATVWDKTTGSIVAFTGNSTGWVGATSSYTCTHGTCAWSNASSNGGRLGHYVLSSSPTWTAGLSGPMVAGDLYVVEFEAFVSASSGFGGYNTYDSAVFHAGANLDGPGTNVTLQQVVEY